MVLHNCFRLHSTPVCLVAALCLPLLCLVSPAQASVNPGTENSSAIQIRPYRVLVVTEHGGDPSGLVVSAQLDRFQPVVALLKAWSVPFDILRLDVQTLDASYLFRRSGAIRYGAVIWVADPASYGTQSLAALDQAVRAGTGLIVIDSRFLDSTLNRLLGLKFKEFYTSTDAFHLAQAHSITRDITAGNNPLLPHNENYSVRIGVEPTGAEVLAAQGQHPVLTVNQIDPESSAIWLGAPDLAALCESPFWRSIFFRSLLSSMGYLVVPNIDYQHRIIFELDDWGTADKGFLSYWRYVEPDEETIRQYLIRPLLQHHAVASAMTDTGYVDRRSKRIVSPWVQNFTDRYGKHQDYASTRKGLKDALAAGVLNIESHGWTHMEPDLESPPGPWWTADLSGEGSVDGWYSEFHDRRRKKEVPAAAQLFHMERSLEELRSDFGVQALELKPGGDAWSKSQFNNTAALASRVGFGLFHGDTATYFLDRQGVFDMKDVVWQFDTGYDTLPNLHPERWPNHPDGPIILGFHDRDISLDHDFLTRLFAALPTNYRTLGTNQYIGILHTAIATDNDTGKLQIDFAQDNHYCAYFAKHASSWRLWLADSLRKQLAASHSRVSIDGKPTAQAANPNFQKKSIVIDLPPGVGIHTWRLEPITRSTQP